MQEKGWGHKHKEGGRSSGEIAEDAEAVRFQDQVTEIFAEQLFEWEEKINSKDTITKAEFGQLFGGFYDKVNLERFDSEDLVRLLMIMLAMVEEVIKRNLSSEEETGFDQAFREKLIRSFSDSPRLNS